MLEAGLGLGVDLAPPLDVTVGRGGRIEYVEIDRRPNTMLRYAVRVGDNGVHEFVVRGGDAVEVDRHVVLLLLLERGLSIW